jgi:hypothetical protein
LWLAGGMFMAWVATENFRSVDRLLNSPNPVASLEFRTLGPQASRLLLRYAASEQNRYLFENWEIVQIMLGILFFLFMLFGTHEGKFSLIAALLLLAIAASQRLILTPELIAIGRTIDFVPSDSQSGARTKFMLLHYGYEGVEVFKWVVVLALAGRLIISRRRSASAEEKQQLELLKRTTTRPAGR